MWEAVTGAEEEVERKTDGMGGVLSQKEGCIRAAWEGITVARAIMQLFLLQKKKRELD